jgi:DNA-binding transcriptional LysR family regulator
VLLAGIELKRRKRTMNQIHDEIELLAVVADPLTRLNHGYASISQLCRRLGFSDDFVRRGLAKLERRFHGPLIGVENYRLTLTALGQPVFELARRLRDLGTNGEDSTEILTVECAPILAEMLLPQVLPSFMEVYGGLLSLRVCNLVAASVRQNIAAQRSAFGFGCVQDDDARDGIEVLEARIPWVVLIPAGHRLQSGVGPVADTDLRPDERVFVCGEVSALPGLRQWLQGVESAYRVECDSFHLIQRLAKAGLGLGVTLDFDCEGQSDGVSVRPIADVQEQKLCFYLPRRAADLSEPARTLADAIRKHFEVWKDESRSTSPTNGEATTTEISATSHPEETTLALEETDHAR